MMVKKREGGPSKCGPGTISLGHGPHLSLGSIYNVKIPGPYPEPILGQNI